LQPIESRRLLPRAAKVLLLLAAGLLFACRSQPEVSDADLVILEQDEVAARIGEATAEAPVVLVDVRPFEAYAAGHIPGAIHRPLTRLERGEAALEGAALIIVYGPGWRSSLSPAAAKRLLAYGYQNVRDFRGGMTAWRDAGRRIEMASERSGSPRE